MTDDVLLAKVKAGLSVSGTAIDAVLLPKLMAVKGYMSNAGISSAQIQSDLGIATLTIGVSDLWTLESGGVKFSEVFLHILMPQLMAVSLP